jgi:Zn-dependent protease
MQLGGLLVFLHWTVPAVGLGAGALVVTSVGSAGPLEFLVTVLAAVGVILVHELGHAVVGKLLGIELHAVILHGTGGMCVFEGLPDRLSSRLLLLSGGAVSQLVLLSATLLVARMYVGHPPLALSCIAFVFVLFNSFVLIACLLPYGNSDGAQILVALRQAWQGHRRAT